LAGNFNEEHIYQPQKPNHIMEIVIHSFIHSFIYLTFHRIITDME